MSHILFLDILPSLTCQPRASNRLLKEAEPFSVNDTIHFKFSDDQHYGKLPDRIMHSIISVT